MTELGHLRAEPHLAVPPHLKPPSMDDILYVVTDNSTNANGSTVITQFLEARLDVPRGSSEWFWSPAQFPSGCSLDMAAVNSSASFTSSLATWQITGNTTLYNGDLDANESAEVSEVPAWYLPYRDSNQGNW